MDNEVEEGRTAYTAFCESAGMLVSNGEPQIPWHTLSDFEKGSWQHAAEMVLIRHAEDPAYR